MTEIHVANVDGAYRCYRVVAGRHREYFGPRFGGPRLAGQYADLSAGRPIAPLRHPVTRSGDDTTLPAAGELREGTPHRRIESPVAANPPASDRA